MILFSHIMMSYEGEIRDPTMQLLWLVDIIASKDKLAFVIHGICICCSFIVVEFITDRTICSLMDILSSEFNSNKIPHDSLAIVIRLMNFRYQ